VIKLKRPNLFLIFAFLVLPLNAFASLKEDAIKQLPSKEIIVTGHPDYAPVVWQTKKQKHLQGISIALLELAFKDLGVKVKTFNAGSWARAQEEVKEGRADVLLPPYKNEERLQIYNFTSEPFSQDETVIFVRKDNPIQFRKYDDLAKYSGVAIINDSFGNEFDQIIKSKLKIERLTTTEKCFEFLMSKRADYVIAGLNSGLTVLEKTHFEDKIKILPKRVVTAGLFVAISKKSKWDRPAIIDFLNHRLQVYSRTGVTKKLEEKFRTVFNDEKKF
jgi:polar amino acid transport system substrate-binding protein